MLQRLQRPVFSGVMCLILAFLLGACSGGGGEPGGTDATGAASPPRMAGKNLVLITCDTTRSDFVTCYGGEAGLTPNIDRLASQGVLFEEAYSQTNVTNPSHVSILSGLYAIQSEIMTNFRALPEEVDILPSMFRRLGYTTGGFPAAPQLSSRLLNLPDFDRTFEVDEVVDADENVDRAIAWLEDSGAGTDGKPPFFLWLHLYDPHTQTWSTDETIVKMEPTPFTHGAMRFCYRMKKRAGRSNT